MEISQLRLALGPLANSLPRIATVIVCGSVALIAAGQVGRAYRTRQSGRLSLAWFIGLVAVFGGCLALRSLEELGGRSFADDPLTLEGALSFAFQKRWLLVLAAIWGAAWASFVRLRIGKGDVSAAAVFGHRPDRAEAIGALGETLVAGRVRDLGYPILRNIILVNRKGSAEIDALVRVPDGVIVLEVKNWSGRVAGTESSGSWIRSGATGRVYQMPNAVRQNLGHVAAVESYVADRRVRVRGYVVSCGRASFEGDLGRFVVPMDDLARVLFSESQGFPDSPVAVAKAWERLGSEAAQSARRRPGHVERVRRLKAIAGVWK